MTQLARLPTVGVSSSLGAATCDGPHSSAKLGQLNLAAQQPGYLGYESAGEEHEISVSYWQSLQAITGWKQQAEHLVGQRRGRTQWYSQYRVRVCKVEREYSFSRPSETPPAR